MKPLPRKPAAPKAAAPKVAATKANAVKATAAVKVTAPKAAAPRGVVAAKPSAAKGLRDLFEVGLKDIYYAEKVFAKNLPRIAKNATSPELVKQLNGQLAVTKEQVSRLEQIFKNTGIKARAKKCEAMDGLIRETQELIQHTVKGNVRDACIIASDQKVEHYEIAAYGTLHAYAKTLGEHEAANLLALTLDEAKKMDATLTSLATTKINNQAWRADAVAKPRK